MSSKNPARDWFKWLPMEKRELWWSALYCLNFIKYMESAEKKKWNSREWNHASVCFVKWEHSCTMRRLVLMEFRFKIIEIRFCNRFAINLSIIFSSISRILLVNSILFNISLGHFIKMILIGNLRQFEISISNKRWTFSLYAPKSIEFLKHYDLAM